MLLLPLLPIFLIGFFPMLMFALMGFGGLCLLGILLISAGLSDALDAHRQFNQHIIVNGFGRRTEEAIYTSNLNSAIRSASAMRIGGFMLIIASICGFLYFG